MAIFKTLKDLQTKTAKPERQEGDRIPKFFTVKAGEEYRIRFRQELSEDLNGYVEEAGVAQVLQVHTNPGDFTKSALCTGDNPDFDYKCWACEQIAEDRGWRAKAHLVVNVAVLIDDKWEPRVLDHKFTPAHVAENLVEYAGEYETILDRDYKIKRKGAKQDTQYTLVPLAAKDAADEIAELPFHELGNMYRILKPAEQAGYYLATEDSSSGSKGWD